MSTDDKKDRGKAADLIRQHCPELLDDLATLQAAFRKAAGAHRLQPYSRITLEIDGKPTVVYDNTDEMPGPPPERRTSYRNPPASNRRKKHGD